MTPTWLLVWEGAAVGPDATAAAVAAVTPGDPQASTLSFAETDGPRRALLLVHWTAGERDHVLQAIEPQWDYGFVNEVHDLGD